MNDKMAASMFKTLGMIADREAKEATKQRSYGDLAVLNILSAVFKEPEKAAGGIQRT